MRFRQKPCQAAGAAGHSDREFAWKMTEAWCCAGRKLIHAAIESELLAIRAGRNHPRWRPALKRNPPLVPAWCRWGPQPSRLYPKLRWLRTDGLLTQPERVTRKQFSGRRRPRKAKKNQEQAKETPDVRRTSAATHTGTDPEPLTPDRDHETKRNIKRNITYRHPKP